MKLVKYNQHNPTYPSSFSSVLDRLFNDSFPQEGNSFQPPVDISEDDNSYDIQLAVPGVEKEDFKVDLVDGKLTISGERKMVEKKEGKNFHSLETQYGIFTRSFYLPEDIMEESIEAAYEDGILKVHLPKAEKKVKKSAIEVK